MRQTLTLAGKTVIPFLVMLCMASGARAQNSLTRQFRENLDSLSALVRERTGADVRLGVKSVTRQDNTVSFNFTQSLGDVPWRKEDIEWLRETLACLLPEGTASCRPGKILCNGQAVSDFVVPELHNNGMVHGSAYSRQAPAGEALVTRLDGMDYRKGLQGRHIVVWHSHGRYFEQKENRWKWQRARNFMTVEDMFTQSFVLPFLIPMLENAGAVVLNPRERDVQRHEAIVDNDPAFEGPREGLTRRSGEYTEKGFWSNAGEGFADRKRYYTDDDNPFRLGSARQCRVYDGCGETSSVTWTPDIPQRGEYAVYISYRSMANSSSCAHYTVRHMGGESEFSVNQKMGGGTWIYLGTFEFCPEQGHCVVLDNTVPDGGCCPESAVVTADAVKFGGGMGKIARGSFPADREEWESSGLPAYTEGALYNMQWSGADTSVIRRHGDDYTDDFADRGAWVMSMSGGSAMNPEEKGRGIPVDLTLAFHSDAGTHPNDSTVGTLGIYTLKCDGKRKLPDGGDRMMNRVLCNYVQTQVVNDIRAVHDSLWNRRETADRSYSESRTSGTPSMILELLSHQNFEDMKSGHDPAFKFTVSRAVYKGILKFLSDRYSVSYRVQPLPVRDFAAVAMPSGKIRLSWRERPDSLEPTAAAAGFLVQTRIGDGAFDNWTVADVIEHDGEYCCFIEAERGKIYSFRVSAFNEGGRSFPSETLCAALPENDGAGADVMIVNNFTRVAAPLWFDTPEYAGFNCALDSGVPYIRDISYIGDMYEFRRSRPWVDDDNPGFGASDTDMAGLQTAGNSFDYPYIHGRAILASGRGFSSCSSGAFSNDSTLIRGYSVADIICGKQISTPHGGGRGRTGFSVFPEELQDAIVRFTRRGGDVLVSGSNIGTDLWDSIYPVPADSLYQAGGRYFAQSVLGYTWVCNKAANGGAVSVMPGKKDFCKGLDGSIRYVDKRNERIYHVESPDGIKPSDSRGFSFLRYAGTDIPAAVCSERRGYRTVCFGFPLEVLEDGRQLETLMGLCLDYFSK